MRILIQRVSRARVTTAERHDEQIGKGLLLFVGIENDDGEDDAVWLAAKIANLRIFNDDTGVMNLSLLDVDGEAMIVSQFTLHARTKKGNRPSYVDAASPEKSVPLYRFFVNRFEETLGKRCAVGVFGAMMQVELINDGPVTIMIDSKQKR
ncbi:MAG: D-tyrosyl-tRNA(Tyr) deacylase [Cytophagaceae bacterium]|jgi:D-tyrosyl-tRNA(Tyr) deacylase|nr:D-tyrosyl-tRNA(Tyr) deacylase [Cytophagaceae bacterium]